MAAGGDGVARQAELRWIEGNVCFKKVPSSMQEPPSHPKLPPRALMRAPPSTPPYMVQVTILPPPLPLLRLLAFCQTVTPCYIQRISGVVVKRPRQVPPLSMANSSATD